MLSRNADALLVSANEDFKAALQRNRALRLDPRVFSPEPHRASSSAPS
jgi:hypothetical protein